MGTGRPTWHRASAVAGDRENRPGERLQPQVVGPHGKLVKVVPPGRSPSKTFTWCSSVASRIIKASGRMTGSGTLGGGAASCHNRSCGAGPSMAPPMCLPPVGSPWPGPRVKTRKAGPWECAGRGERAV